MNVRSSYEYLHHYRGGKQSVTVRTRDAMLKVERHNINGNLFFSLRQGRMFIRMILKTDFLEETFQRHTCVAFSQAARHCSQGLERIVGRRLFFEQSEYLLRFHGLRMFNNHTKTAPNYPLPLSTFSIFVFLIFISYFLLLFLFFKITSFLFFFFFNPALLLNLI